MRFNDNMDGNQAGGAVSVNSSSDFVRLHPPPISVSVLENVDMLTLGVVGAKALQVRLVHVLIELQ